MARAVAAIVLVNNVLTPPLIRWLPCKVLAVIGKDSMSYYVTHFVFLLLLRILLVRILGITDAMDKFLLMLAACVVLLPVVVWVLKRKTTWLSK